MNLLSKYNYLIFTLLLVLIGRSALLSQTDTTINLLDLSIEQLMDTPIEISSKKVQHQVEAPSIVTVITSTEIQKYGYKDLADVLRMVPGFEFGVDVQSLYGLGFRGIWAHEGKALVMINGMSVNCFGFGNGNYFGTFPITLIDKIEILRGPGSAIYGGFAEVAVVNIITKKGKTLNGAEMQTTAGSINGSLAYNGSLSAGINKIKVGESENSTMDLAVTMTSNYTPVSTDTYKDFYGGSFKMGNKNSWRKFNGVYLAGSAGNLKFGYNNSYTSFLAQDGFGAVIPKSNSNQNTNELNNKVQSFNLHYQAAITSNISCTPKLEISSGNPISSAVSANHFNTANGPVFFNAADPWQNQSALARKAQLEMEIEDKFSDKSSLQGSIGYQYNHLQSITITGNPGLQTSSNPGDTSNTYGKGTKFCYLQFTHQEKTIGLTAGARYEITPFGEALAPRVGVTFSKPKLNAKLLYGRAFRVPMFWQAYSRQFFIPATPLKPETSDSYEMELGYKFTSNIKLSINLFFIDIKTPIVYLGSNNSYNNFGRIQSMGGEYDLQIRYKKYGGFVNVSYAVPGKQTSREFLDESKNFFLALPTLKVNAGMYLTYKWFTLSPSCTYLGERYGQSEFSAQNSSVGYTVFQTTTYKPLVLLNSNLVFTLNKTFDLNLAVYNLLDSKYAAIQPYYGGHSPLPASSQQFNIGLKVKI